MRSVLPSIFFLVGFIVWLGPLQEARDGKSRDIG
jgi:hypothetical protein